MDNKGLVRNCLILGFAIFAIFFGAGNLIFPPHLGFTEGSDWGISFWGFAITGVLLPLLGVFSIGFVGHSLKDLGDKVHPYFSVFLGLSIILVIGPLVMMPRTGATAYELSLLPIFPDFKYKFLFTIPYFIFVYLFTINPSKVVGYIGKILTPSILILLAIIIIEGMLNPIGEIVINNRPGAFSVGFISGYNTADALASLMIAVIIINAATNLGCRTEKMKICVLLGSSLVACLGLCFIYAGLMYLGASAGTSFGGEMPERTQLISFIVSALLGNVGNYCFSLIVFLACATTAIGITSAISEYAEEMTGGRLKYKTLVTISIVFSAAISNLSVDNIVELALPFFKLIYPMVIFLILAGVIFRNRIKSRLPYIGGIIGVSLVSIIDTLLQIGIDIPALTSFRNSMPFGALDLGWILPCVLCFSLGYLISLSPPLKRAVKKV